MDRRRSAQVQNEYRECTHLPHNARHPGRGRDLRSERIVALASADGPLTTALLARRLGVPGERLLPHLRALEMDRLVMCRATAADGGILQWAWLPAAIRRAAERAARGREQRSPPQYAARRGR